jgi:hypothetical protein
METFKIINTKTKTETIVHALNKKGLFKILKDFNVLDKSIFSIRRKNIQILLDCNSYDREDLAIFGNKPSYAQIYPPTYETLQTEKMACFNEPFEELKEEFKHYN